MKYIHLYNHLQVKVKWKFQQEINTKAYYLQFKKNLKC